MLTKTIDNEQYVKLTDVTQFLEFHSRTFREYAIASQIEDDYECNMFASNSLLLIVNKLENEVR
jgi:hypothetical protein